MSEYLDKYFESFSSALLEFVVYYQDKVLCKILDEKRYVEEPERFYFTIMTKSNNSLDVINLLIRNFHAKPHFHASLFVLLRAILSDIMITEFVSVSPDTDESRVDLIKGIYNDHVARTYNSISGTYALLSGWSNKDIALEQKSFISSNPQYFDENGKLLTKSVDVSVKKVVTAILSRKAQESDLSFLRMLYSHYDMFSKYEHVGELTFRLVHKPYFEESVKIQFIEVFESVGIIVSALINYCNVWDELLLEEVKDLQSLVKRIFKNDLSLLNNY